MIIRNATGNVGIGTTNPGKKFCVEGDLVSQSGTKALTLTAGINATGAIWANNSWDPANPTSNWGEAIRFNGTNIGIGNITAAYKLDVDGDINFTGTLYQNGSAFSSGGGAVFSESGSEAYYTGNVGIGTNNPEEKLDVNGTLYLRGGTSSSIMSNVEATNKTNTYISFGANGTSSDGASLRQIGGNNGMHMVLSLIHI